MMDEKVAAVARETRDEAARVCSATGGHVAGVRRSQRRSLRRPPPLPARDAAAPRPARVRRSAPAAAAAPAPRSAAPATIAAALAHAAAHRRALRATAEPVLAPVAGGPPASVGPEASAGDLARRAVGVARLAPAVARVARAARRLVTAEPLGRASAFWAAFAARDHLVHHVAAALRLMRRHADAARAAAERWRAPAEPALAPEKEAAERAAWASLAGAAARAASEGFVPLARACERVACALIAAKYRAYGPQPGTGATARAVRDATRQAEAEAAVGARALAAAAEAARGAARRLRERGRERAARRRPKGRQAAEERAGEASDEEPQAIENTSSPESVENNTHNGDDPPAESHSSQLTISTTEETTSGTAPLDHIEPLDSPSKEMALDMAAATVAAPAAASATGRQQAEAASPEAQLQQEETTATTQAEGQTLRSSQQSSESESRDGGRILEINLVSSSASDSPSEVVLSQSSTSSTKSSKSVIVLTQSFEAPIAAKSTRSSKPKRRCSSTEPSASAPTTPRRSQRRTPDAVNEDGQCEVSVEVPNKRQRRASYR